MSHSQMVYLLRDTINFLRAQLAVRIKGLYCPSLFGHYGVNSICNLRCSYCYIHEPETYPKGFIEKGLELEQAKKVLETMREESFAIRLQGGEPLLYPHINELARYAKRDLYYRNVSIITNGTQLVDNFKKFEDLLDHLDILTLSIDGTRLKQYPEEMDALLKFLPQLKKVCEEKKIGLTSNYTASWEELEQPHKIEKTILKYQDYIPYFYIMPVRQIGKVPLHLLKNSQKLMQKYSLGHYAGPQYPKEENIKWYQKHCNPKLKIKVNAMGEVIYPCENFSGTIGSLVTHEIREIWTSKLDTFPNKNCLGCGKQRFRLKAFKRIDQQIVFGLKKAFGKLNWEQSKKPIFKEHEEFIV